ncbi:hypothetical protein EDD15DRAFT_2359163 [Pisolithus albus]|nr:hypothetical protein EDD15DRAFT_2359163 [Pisolithus albus]
MAAADALWRALIHRRWDSASERDWNLSVQTWIQTLDCWRTEVTNFDPRLTTLEALADTKPTFTQLKDIASRIAHKYVATNAIERVRRKPGSQRDMQFENALVINKYMLLYEELTHAMNTGDIGRVELCIVAWILVFKATGKHKYAAYMTEFLLNVHFVYPAGLRRAVRYSMLVNPSGQRGKFRGVDWCVELNNLFIKVINGGKFSNHTIPRIILESPLVQVYRNLHGVFQKHFLHNHVTTRRQEADMSLTFKELCTYFEKNQPHKMQTGRSSKWCMDDLIDVGHTLMEKTEGELGQDGVEEDGESFLTLEDVAVELGL